MTEAQWLASDKPRQMVQWLLAMNGGRASNRKLRLFADECGQRTHNHYWEGWADRESASGEFSSVNAALYWVGAKVGQHERVVPTKDEAVMMAALVREIFGNPFRCYAWSEIHDAAPSGHELQFLAAAWRTADVVDMAQVAYETRDWSGLGALSDALEEAGCPADTECPTCYGTGSVAVQPRGPGGQMIMSRECPDCKESGRGPHRLLAHLRSPGPHVRGCWALDLILGRE